MPGIGVTIIGGSQCLVETQLQFKKKKILLERDGGVCKTLNKANAAGVQ